MKGIFISGEHDFTNYSNFLNKATESTIYHTKEYVDFISNYLRAESFYLAIEENQKILGVLPFVLFKNSTFGNIINSNPYFGSPGGIIVHPDLLPTQKLKIKQNLLKNFTNFAKENDCILSTIITSPFDRDQSFYFQNLKHEYLDTRVAQITLLPMGDRKNNNENFFLERFASRCRRAIKGAEKKGIEIRETHTKGKILDDFYKIYLDNINSKGGMVREKKFFETAFEKLPKGFCGLRYAELKGTVIAGIFQFYYKDIIEYCQPAIHHDYRDTNVTNLLVFTGMQEGYNNGYSYWNFGGTWNSQENVYNFKRSFGAIDFPYYYFTVSYSDHAKIKKLTVEELKKEYSGFYVIPYSQLTK